MRVPRLNTSVGWMYDYRVDRKCVFTHELLVEIEGRGCSDLVADDKKITTSIHSSIAN